MPSLTTHHFFALDVLNNLDEDIQNTFIDEKNIYTIFAQSHDILYYYFLDSKNSKRIKDLGHRAHHEKTQEYLINIVKYIKEKHLEHHQQLIAYIYGSITHYCLDSTCHPYIFYKSGIYRSREPQTIKYRGGHTRMEKDIDAIYYELNTHKKYNHCNLNRDIIKKPQFNNELIECLNYVYEKTYQEKNIGNYYYKSINRCKLINTFVSNDYFGIKKLFYKLIDFITKSNCISSYSTHILNPNLEYLNLKNKEWHHPSNKNIIYTSSFPELYERAFKKSKDIINSIHKVLFYDEDISSLTHIIPDIDYSTGFQLDDNLRMNYFE